MRARQKNRNETNPALSTRRLKLGTFQTNLDSACVMSDLEGRHHITWPNTVACAKLAYCERTVTALRDRATEAAVDESHDAYIRADSDLAFERTGKDVGTPIITFHPGQSDEASFFGPVIASIPRGDAALKLWDAIEIVATTSGMAELKRSNRAKPVFD